MVVEMHPKIFIQINSASAYFFHALNNFIHFVSRGEEKANGSYIGYVKKQKQQQQ